jgi:hypothetical protein
MRACRSQHNLIRIIDLLKGGRRREGPFFAGPRPNRHPQKLLVILHSFAVTVEQLCARSADAPSLEDLRLKHCFFCGQPAWNAATGTLQIIGHGIYSRQVRGFTEKAWIVISVQRFLCLMCGHTMSRLPDWLHPRRWYAGTVIIEALFRRCILMESESAIAVLFGRPQDSTEWKSLRRWRTQLLISPTLWGWLGPRLGLAKPAGNWDDGKAYLERLLAEGGLLVKSGIEAIGQLPGAVRKTLQDLVHNRKKAWSMKQFLPGFSSNDSPGRLGCGLPTEKDSGPGPP